MDVILPEGLHGGCSTWNPLSKVPRGTSLADAESTEDLPQKLICCHRTGDPPQRSLGETQLFRLQFKGLRKRSARKRLLRLSQGDPMILFSSTLGNVLWTLLALSLAAPAIRAILRKRKAPA